MVARQAKAAGLDIVLGGREAEKLAGLARELGVPYRVFRVDADDLSQTLRGTRILLNCAGPFARTAEPLMCACTGVGVHYLDIAAEINVYRLAEQLGAQAAEAGAMLLPGCGLGGCSDGLPRQARRAAC